jgi:hypothetical protein
MEMACIFELSKLCTREHFLTLFKTGCNMDCTKYILAHIYWHIRMVDIRDSLDAETVACDSLNGFETRTHKILQSRRLDLRLPSLFTNSTQLN